MPRLSFIVYRRSFIVENKSLLIVISTFLLIATINLSLITYHLSLASAQSPLETAKKDFVQKNSDYSTSKNAYIGAKATYTKFQTATAKADAFSKTKTYMITADNLLLSYLALVSQYVSDPKLQGTSFDKALSDQQVSEQTNFIQNHLNSVDNSKTLEELPPLAASLKSQVDKSTQPKIGKVVASLDIARTEAVFSDFKNLAGKLEEFTQSRTTPQNQTLVANWQSEIGDIRDKTQTNLTLTNQSYQRIITNYFNSFQIKDTLQKLDIAKTELKRSSQLFEEMTKII